MLRHAVLCALLAALGFARLDAQTIRGRIVDANGEPVSVALLTLLDADGVRLRTALTTGTGEYSLQAGGVGSFQLRVDRIGLVSHTTPPFQLGAGQVLDLPITVSAAPIVLAGIQAESSSRCVVRPEAGGAIATLWDEATKALGITAAVEASGIVRLTGIHYVRELDGTGVRQTAVRSRRSFSTLRAPFDALPAETLARDGFARFDADGSLVYYGPSAAVLLSDPFLDQHCFNRVLEDPTDGSRVGLGFEPVRGTRTVGIAGTMWLDRETGEVRVVEYAYRDPAGSIPDGGRGRVEFFRLPTGAPIVSRWWIRMPTALQLPGVGAPGTIRVTSLQEEGGIVLDEGGAPLGPDDGLLAQLEDGLAVPGAEAGGAPAPPEASDGVLDTVLADILARNRLGSETLVRGKVVDAMNGTGVVGATVVFLQGRSRYSAQTDEAGEFILAGIEEGPHRVTVRHLAFPTVEETIEVGGGGRATQVEVSLHREVVQLSPIEVTVDRRPTFGALVPVYDRLELQRSLGLGRFWDRSEIEASGAFAITDVLRTLPGVSALGSSITLNTLNPGCSRRSPLIYLDGVRFQTAGEPISTLVPLFQIEVLEVYRRASEVPGEYGGSDAQCGVIVIWTRRGG